MELLLTALGLLLVFEGIGPASSPKAMRQAYQYFAKMSDRHLRFVGLGSIIVGAVIIYLVRP